MEKGEERGNIVQGRDKMAGGLGGACRLCTAWVGRSFCNLVVWWWCGGFNGGKLYHDAQGHVVNECIGSGTPVDRYPKK